MHTLARLRPIAVLAVLGLGAASCSSNPVLPFQSEVTNAPDNFQMQATDVTNATTTQSYAWTNTGTRATINHSTTTTAGSVQLTIRDGAGVQVYTKAIVPSLNEATATGASGTWTIVVRMTGYSGTLNFRAQKL